jgi:replicative DNA helicase
MSTNDMQPPCNIDAECALLGSLLIDGDAYHEVADVVSARDFYRGHNAEVFKAIEELARTSTAIDYLTVGARLRGVASPQGGWDTYLLNLVSLVPTSINATDYARIVEETAVRRRVIQAAGKIAGLGYGQDGDLKEQLAQAETLLFEARGTRDRRSVALPRQYMSEYIERMEYLRDHDETPGIPTGLTDLDRLLKGLQRPHQYVLAARPGMGKSAAITTIAAHAALKLNKRVLIFSLEMSRAQIISRIISGVTKINSQKVQAWRELGEADQQRVYEAAGLVSESSLYIDDNAGLSAADIRARCMKMYAEHGLDLVIFDNMHLMPPVRSLGNTMLEIGETSAALAELYKALDVPGITVAQLSRGVENRANKRPILSDLRESGRIEENAYAVLFLYREAYYDETADQGLAELSVAKHREGPTGTINLYWDAPHVSFRNLQRQDVVLPSTNGHERGAPALRVKAGGR